MPADPGFAFELLDPASPTAVAQTAPFWAEVWGRNAAHWMVQAGQYTITPDYRPVIGPTHVEGLFVNTGYSGHGIMLGPAGGRICADTLTGAMESSANPFQPERTMEPAPQPTL